jgi:MFS family permease
LAFILPLQIAGRIVGAALWGFLGDRYGHHTGIRGVAIAFSIPSLIALILATLSPAAVAAPAFGLLFFVLGFALEGWPPFINYMLDIVEEQERPLYAGLMSVGFVPAALAPIVGGFLIRQWGYPLLFGSATATAVCGVILATSLPRAKSDAHGE